MVRRSISVPTQRRTGRADSSGYRNRVPEPVERAKRGTPDTSVLASRSCPVHTAGTVRGLLRGQPTSVGSSVPPVKFRPRMSIQTTLTTHRLLTQSAVAVIPRVGPTLSWPHPALRFKARFVAHFQQSDKQRLGCFARLATDDRSGLPDEYSALILQVHIPAAAGAEQRQMPDSTGTVLGGIRHHRHVVIPPFRPCGGR